MSSELGLSDDDMPTGELPSREEIKRAQAEEWARFSGYAETDRRMREERERLYAKPRRRVPRALQWLIGLVIGFTVYQVANAIFNRLSRPADAKEVGK